jgi:hypothetical protein
VKKFQTKKTKINKKYQLIHGISTTGKTSHMTGPDEEGPPACRASNVI